MPAGQGKELPRRAGGIGRRRPGEVHWSFEREREVTWCLVRGVRGVRGVKGVKGMWMLWPG